MGLVLQRVRQLWPQLVPPERLRESAQVDARPEEKDGFCLAWGFGRSSTAKEEGPGFPALSEGPHLPLGERALLFFAASTLILSHDASVPAHLSD